MIAKKELSSLLKKDGLILNEDELQSVLHTLLSLAKIEYELYQDQKSDQFHGSYLELQEISRDPKQNSSKPKAA